MNRKLNKKGLELLRQRDVFPDNLDNVLSLLPPIAKLFFRYYNTGDWEDMYGRGETVNLPVVGECGVALNEWFEDVYFDGVKYKDSFGLILPLEGIQSEYNEYKLQSEVWHKSGLMRIGNMAHWDVILIGMEKHNRDEIYIYGEAAWGGLLNLIANDIFDFFSKVNQYWTDEDVRDYTGSKITGEDLYQNFGEDFWRIRE